MAKVIYDTRPHSFIKDGKIDVEELELALESVLADAKEANKDNGAGARRFRNNTIDLEKKFLDMRKVTPVK